MESQCHWGAGGGLRWNIGKHCHKPNFRSWNGCSTMIVSSLWPFGMFFFHNRIFPLCTRVSSLSPAMFLHYILFLGCSEFCKCLVRYPLSCHRTHECDCRVWIPYTHFAPAPTQVWVLHVDLEDHRFQYQHLWHHTLEFPPREYGPFIPTSSLRYNGMRTRHPNMEFKVGLIGSWRVSSLRLSVSGCWAVGLWVCNSGTRWILNQKFLGHELSEKLFIIIHQAFDV